MWWADPSGRCSVLFPAQHGSVVAPKAGFDFCAGPCALQGKSFFPELVEYMTSGPVYAYVLARVDAIRAWRQLMCASPLA